MTDDELTELEKLADVLYRPQAEELLRAVEENKREAYVALTRLALLEPVVAAAKEWHEHPDGGLIVTGRLHRAVDALLAAEKANEP